MSRCREGGRGRRRRGCGCAGVAGRGSPAVTLPAGAGKCRAGSLGPVWRRGSCASGHAEPCWVCCDAGGAPAGSPVPMGSGSQRISLKMLPVGRGCGRRAAGPPGTARRMTQQSPQHQGHLLTGPGHSARGAAARGAAVARSGAAARRCERRPDRGWWRSRAQLPSGLPGRRRVDEVRRLSPGPRDLPSAVRPSQLATAFPGLAQGERSQRPLALWPQSCDHPVNNQAAAPSAWSRFLLHP